MRLTLLAIFSILLHSSFAQLVTSTAQSPAGLVQNVLLGTGVTVSNISYNGAPAAIGSFTANGTNLGISEGIVMTTGTVIDNGNGPQGPNNQANSGVDNSRPGFSLLTQQISGGTTYDATILEFDFVPYSDTVRFKYVFGSEEYPEYVNTQFNDVFAFFISGPGISGQKNMALIPGTNTAVAINNVNNGPTNNGAGASNPAYYVYNGTGSVGPYNASNNYIQYDGFTKVLEAVSKVQCGQTYHLIIAIADVGDGIYDSGIFLEANSLSSKTPVDVTYMLSNQSFNDPSIMAEGCTSATVKLTRTGDISSAMTIPIIVSGTATEGVDYTNIPPSVTFNPGQTEIQFNFDANADGIAEGPESILLSFQVTDPCGNVKPIDLELGIDDVQPVQVQVTTSDVSCPGDEVEVVAEATGGGGGYTYLWNTNETTSSIFVSPTSTDTYTVTVTDNCLNQSATGSGTVNVPVFTPLVLNPTPDITEICPYLERELFANASGASGNYTYQWSSDQGGQLGNNPSQIVLPHTTTLYTVTVTDFCGESVSADILYTITSPPLVVNTSPDVEICPGDSVLISAASSGGYGQHFYSWDHSGESSPVIWVNPQTTTTYIVSVSDECQTFTVKDSVKVITVKPDADFIISSHTLFNNLPVTFQNLSTNATSYEWTFGDGNSSTVVHPNNTYADPGYYLITLIATDDKGCKDTIAKPISIEEEWYVYVPNTFTPDGDRFNNTFKGSFVGVQEVLIQVFNRWGELVFTSDDQNFSWDGTTANGELAPDGTYTYKLFFKTRSGVEKSIAGHVNLLK